jgi:hypothetical protein
MSSASYTSEFELEHPVEIVFPLFSPEGERLWAPGWDYENIMGTTILHEDYVFLTKSHDHAAADAVWIVKKYETEIHSVQYYKVEPQEKVGVVTVKCDDLAEKKTRIQVTYTYIGLSESGNRFIDRFTENDYKKFIDEWKGLLKRYFDGKS